MYQYAYLNVMTWISITAMLELAIVFLSVYTLQSQTGR